MSPASRICCCPSSRTRRARSMLASLSWVASFITIGRFTPVTISTDVWPKAGSDVGRVPPNMSVSGRTPFHRRRVQWLALSLPSQHHVVVPAD